METFEKTTPLAEQHPQFRRTIRTGEFEVLTPRPTHPLLETDLDGITSTEPKAKKSRTRGEGSIYRDRYRDKATGEWKTCDTWSIKYYWLGKAHKESTGSTKRSAAVKLLNKRKAEMAKGRLIGPDLEKVTYEELRAMLLNDYTVNGRRSVDRMMDAVAHLDGFFGRRRVLRITADLILRYVALRKEEGAANATCNRELAALKRMLRLGERAEKVAQRPHIAMLDEDNVRKGFFEEDEFEAILRHLPDDLRPVFEVAYITGWRVKSELLTRHRRHVDLRAGWLRLEPGETKNRKGRMFPLSTVPRLRQALERQLARTEDAERDTGRIIPWLFHRDGEPIKSFRRAWLTACLKAGFATVVSANHRVIKTNRIPHDFRRSAIRNLERAGVPRSTAMALVGHKTESVYRRYAIVDEVMLSEGGAKLGILYARTPKTEHSVLALEGARKGMVASTGRVQAE
jgi:site-specific recombinase XerD